MDALGRDGGDGDDGRGLALLGEDLARLAHLLAEGRLGLGLADRLAQAVIVAAGAGVGQHQWLRVGIGRRVDVAVGRLAHADAGSVVGRVPHCVDLHVQPRLPPPIRSITPQDLPHLNLLTIT